MYVCMFISDHSGSIVAMPINACLRYMVSGFIFTSCSDNKKSSQIKCFTWLPMKILIKEKVMSSISAIERKKRSQFFYINQ